MIAGRALEVVDRLEQRHDREGAALDARRVGEEPGGLGQQIGAEHVAHALRHAEHERAERLAVDLLAEPAHQLEHAQRLGGLAAAARGGARPARAGGPAPPPPRRATPPTPGSGGVAGVAAGAPEIGQRRR